ncbi:MAG: PD-(D/E)XK nuclease family transposase [Verrucomicrobia bacterium]|nr:PD-(D/E)XK nuclease family transposase [Verrucomicrobiota bacterium]
MRCQDRRGRQFIVEMQMNWTSAFFQRVLFNASKAYVRQLEKNDEYELLKSVYGLSLLNDKFPGGSGDYYHHFRLVRAGAQEQVIRDLQLVFVELPKYRENRPEEARVLRWAWLRFLREAGDAGRPGHGSTAELVQEIAVSGEVREAIEIARESAFTPGELEMRCAVWWRAASQKTRPAGCSFHRWGIPWRFAGWQRAEPAAPVSALGLARSRRPASMPISSQRS